MFVVFFSRCINIHNLNLPVSTFSFLLHVVSDIFHNCLPAFLCYVKYVACSKSIRCDFFSAKTNEAQVCCGRKMEGTFTHIRVLFSRQQTASVACSQRVSESVYAACIALLLSAKMTERLEQRHCIKFCQKLGDSQVETIRKIQRVFGDDAMGITQIKEW